MLVTLFPEDGGQSMLLLLCDRITLFFAGVEGGGRVVIRSGGGRGGGQLSSPQGSCHTRGKKNLPREGGHKGKTTKVRGKNKTTNNKHSFMSLSVTQMNDKLINKVESGQLSSLGGIPRDVYVYLRLAARR